MDAKEYTLKYFDKVLKQIKKIENNKKLKLKLIENHPPVSDFHPLRDGIFF